MGDIVWIAIITAIVIGAVALHIYIWKHYHYVCPKCSQCFKPAFMRSFLAVNAAEYRRMKCPNCSNIDYMQALKNKKR